MPAPPKTPRTQRATSVSGTFRRALWRRHRAAEHVGTGKRHKLDHGLASPRLIFLARQHRRQNQSEEHAHRHAQQRQRQHRVLPHLRRDAVHESRPPQGTATIPSAAQQLGMPAHRAFSLVNLAPVRRDRLGRWHRDARTSCCVLCSATVTRFECSRTLPKVEWEGGTARAKSRQQLGGRAQSRRLNRLVADNKRAAQRSKDARHARGGWMGRVQPHARDPGGGLHRRGGASRRCVGRRDSVPPFPAPAPCTRAALGATRQMCLAFQRRETESAGVLFVPRVCGGSWSGALNADREGGGSLRQ